MHNNASNGNRQRNRRIYYAFGFCINRLKWSNKPVPSIQTMVWECQKKGHDTTIRSQNAEQLRENGWLRCSRKPQPLKTYDSSEFGVWSSYTVREAYKPLNLRKATKETIRSKAMKTPKTTNVKISKTSKLNTVSCLTYSAVKSRKRATYSRDPKGDGVSPSVALRLSNCLQS